MAKPNQDLEAIVSKQIAALALQGQSVPEVAQALNISQHQVRKVMGGEEFKALLKRYGDEAVANARNTLKAKSERLAPEVWKTLEALIRSDKGRDQAEGVKLFFRVIGLEKGEEAQGTGSLFIQLPGAAANSTVIEVPSEQEDTDES